MTTATAQSDTTTKLFELGGHLGHKKNRLHPKSRPFVYQIINGTSVIDLSKSVVQLDAALKLFQEIAKSEKHILIVGTKKVASSILAEYAKNAGISYMTSKWLPGLLTNFEMIMKNVKKLQTLKTQQADGEWEKFVKHERMKLAKELSKLDRLYGGILSLSKRPDYLFVVDIKKEKNAVKEAKQNNIPVIAMVDTNSNPQEVAFPIVVNDDAPQVIDYVLSLVVDAYNKGKAARPVAAN